MEVLRLVSEHGRAGVLRRHRGGPGGRLLGFSYIDHLNFGSYGVKVTLFTGLFVLFLAPEFYAPLRELGAHYHAKAQAIGAAEQLLEFSRPT